MRRRVRSFLPLAAPLTLIASCGMEPEPPGGIQLIEPASAYSDGATPVSLRGGPFRPPVGVDTMSGAAQVGTTPFTVFLDPWPSPSSPRSFFLTDSLWRNSAQIDARIAPGLPAGDYTVQMRDPRGELVPSTARFTSLGPDIDGPVITFLQPASGMAVAGGTEVSVVAHIDDGPGHLADAHWLASSPALGGATGDCIFAGDSDDAPAAVDCVFTFIAPLVTVNLAQIDIAVYAEDSVQNSSSATLAIRVAWRPMLTGVTPAMGPMSGGTDIVVAGKGFIADLSQILIDGVSIGGVVADDGIHGVTAPHAPGMAALTVSNGTAGSQPLIFDFKAALKVRIVSPIHGPADQSTLVAVAGNHFTSKTTFFWGQYGQESPIAPDLVIWEGDAGDDSRVNITLPPGHGVISIIAHDPDGGNSELQNAFTYDDPIP